jgi:hypothetical protein
MNLLPKPQWLPVLALTLPLLGCDRIEQPLSTATRFAARMSCSCVFVTGRDLQACVADLPAEAEWLDIAVDPATRTVAASALWMSGVAEFSEGRGCRLRD